MPVLMTYIYFYILYFYYIHRRLTIGPVMGYLACNSNYIIDALCAKYNETWCKGKTAQPLRTKMNFPKGNITRAMQSKPSTAREPGWKMTFIRVGEIAKCFLFPSQILSVLVQAEGRFPLWKAATLPEEADFFFFFIGRFSDGDSCLLDKVHTSVWLGLPEALQVTVWEQKIPFPNKRMQHHLRMQQGWWYSKA